MPALGTGLLFKILRVLLEYGMLFWLLAFMARWGKQLFQDVRKEMLKQQAAEIRQDEAVLVVTDAKEPELMGHRFAFAEQIALGRGEDNDIIIPENFVSHHHAVVYRHGNQFVIEDLGSRNHTYVNEQLLQGRAYLRPGDYFRIGMVTLKFER